jgi:CcmD family protein
MHNLGYLSAAYAIIFAVIFLYVVFLWRRQARLEAQLGALERKLKDVRDELSTRVPQSRSAS